MNYLKTQAEIKRTQRGFDKLPAIWRDKHHDKGAEGFNQSESKTLDKTKSKYYEQQF